MNNLLMRKKFNNKASYLLIGLMLILLAGLYAWQKSQHEESVVDTDKSASAHTDQSVAELLTSMNMHPFADQVQAPDFELTSPAGERVKLSQYRGKIVLISFWATW